MSAPEHRSDAGPARTDLLATFFGTADEPNRRGDLDGAAWRFALPAEAHTVEWRSSTVGHEHDVTTLERLAQVVVRASDDGSDSADLVVGGLDAEGATPGQVSIDLAGAAGAGPSDERLLELQYVDDELRGVVPPTDRHARELLSAHVGGGRSARRGRSRRADPVCRTVTGAIRGAPAGPPAWLVAAARDAGIDVTNHEWALWCRGEYASQKLVLFLLPPGERHPSIAVKIVRDARYNDRLVNESRMLRTIDGLDPAVRAGAPRLRFESEVWGSAVSAQSAVNGTDLRVELARRPELVERVSTWWAAVAASTVGDLDRGQVADRLGELVARYERAYEVPADVVAFLRRQVDAVAVAGVPAVLQHGDPGPWNAVVTDDDQVVFLDWEAGETHGLPLWDLFYFLRSASLVVSTRRPWQSRRRRTRRDLIDGSALGDRIAGHVRAYVSSVGLDPAVVEPLYHLCWVHRAVKESRRLPVERRAHGTFHRFALDGVQGRERPGLRRITMRDGGSDG